MRIAREFPVGTPFSVNENDQMEKWGFVIYEVLAMNAFSIFMCTSKPLAELVCMKLNHVIAASNKSAELLKVVPRDDARNALGEAQPSGEDSAPVDFL